jgi:hypothetical protein
MNQGSYNSNPNSLGFFLDAGAYSWNGGVDGSCCTRSLTLSANEVFIFHVHSDSVENSGKSLYRVNGYAAVDYGKGSILFNGGKISIIDDNLANHTGALPVPDVGNTIRFWLIRALIPEDTDGVDVANNLLIGTKLNDALAIVQTGGGEEEEINRTEGITPGAIAKAAGGGQYTSFEDSTMYLSNEKGFEGLCIERNVPSEIGGDSGEPTDSNPGPKTSVPSETDEPPPSVNPPAANYRAVSDGIVNMNISSVSLVWNAIENCLSDRKRNRNDQLVLIVGSWTNQTEINNSGYNDKLKGTVGGLGFVRKSENEKRY